MSIRFEAVCIDTTDPARLAAFWQQAIGWQQTYAKDDEIVLEPPAGSKEDGVVPDLLFLRVCPIALQRVYQQPSPEHRRGPQVVMTWGPLSLSGPGLAGQDRGCLNRVEDHPEIPEPSSCGLAPLAVTPQAAFAVDGEQECPPERDAAERGVAGCQQHDGCDAEAGE
jgi:hypothetical protein